MKKAKKILALLLCAVLLVGATVAGTVAYLTSQDAVTNTFTVGKVAITLDEARVNADGKPVKTVEADDGTTSDVVVENAEEADRVEENTYHLLPGHEYSKDPIIRVAADSEDCYLFVTVANQIEDIEEADTVATQMKAKGWKPVDDVNNTYVYVGTAEGATAPLAVSANGKVTVFETIKIKSSVDNQTLGTYAGKTITVNAYAVQKDGFETYTAEAIWNATFGAPSADA